ncbi:hypothetical protein [Parageobacillus genomosp. 1]|nr:hypothetical protein [Parageobacillus genomosp. 1]
MIPYDEQSLEYNGPYGCRYLCSDCRYFASESKTCAMLANPAIKISGKNNICRLFEPRIKNPNSPPFNFDDYLEFLGSDYYRPWGIDRTQVIGSARLGEAVIDGGKLARLLLEQYSPLYKSYDKPYCRVNFPRCHVYYDKYTFVIDYRLYREIEFYRDGAIHYVEKRWRETGKARKVQREYNGIEMIG